MARPVRGCLSAGLQQEGTEEPERDPQQEDQPDATEGKDIADYDPDIDCEVSEPKVEQSAQEQRKVDPDAEYVEMDIPSDGTLRQRMMSWEQYMGIMWVHMARGPEIMALKLKNRYIQLGFSPKATKLLIREQELDNPDRLRGVLTDKNVDDICNIVRKSGSKNANRTSNRGQQVSVITQVNLMLAAFLFHHGW